MPAAANTRPLKIPFVIKWQVWDLVSWSTCILRYNILQFCRHRTSIGSNDIWGQAALSSELFVCCNLGATWTIKTLRIIGEEEGCIRICWMKGQFVYIQLSFFFLVGIKISEFGSCTLLMEGFFWTLCAQQELSCAGAWIWESEVGKQVWTSLSGMSHSLIWLLLFQ